MSLTKTPVPTGARKTEERDKCPILLLDGKFDPGLLNLAIDLVRQGKRRFKLFCPFSTVPRTFLFNPFDAFQQARPEDVVRFVLQALNLFSGEEHGRGFYHQMNKQLVQVATYLGYGVNLDEGHLFPVARRQPGPPRSFADLRLLMRHVFNQDKQKYRDGQHVMSIVDGLGCFELLNMTSETDPGHPALKHAIRFADVIANRDVVYGIFPASVDPQLAGLFARLMLLSFLESCKQHFSKTRQSPNAVCFADEAAILYGINFLSILTQARSFGLGLVLCAQGEAQALLPGGTDLRPILNANTVLKQYFSVRDLDEKKQVSQNSGTVLYGDLEYSVRARDLAAGRVTPEYAAADADGVVRVGVKHRPGPRMELEDLDDMNRHPNLCAIKVERNSGLGQFHGTFPAYIPWQMSETEFLRRQAGDSWSGDEEGTVALVEANLEAGETVPAVDAPEKEALEQSLLELERELRGGRP